MLRCVNLDDAGRERIEKQRYGRNIDFAKECLVRKTGKKRYK